MLREPTRRLVAVPPELAEPAKASVPRKPSPEDAYALARKKYLAGERVDMRQLAAEIGINRVTLYRWVGDLNTLLVEVIWSLTEATLAQEWAKVRRKRGPRVPLLLSGYLEAAMEQPGARTFAMENNERVMRLLTLGRHGYQPRLVAAIRGYLAEDLATGRITSTLTLDELAYASVRIAESYYYLPTIAGQPPDPEGARRVLEVLLRP